SSAWERRADTSPAAVFSGVRSKLVSERSTNAWLRRYGLQPVLSAKVEEHACAESEHDREQQRVTPPPVQLRHVVEIHAVKAGQKGERNEDGGDDRQDFHHFAHPVVDVGEMDFQQARKP